MTAGAICAFPLIAAGCSNIIGDGIDELNYDSTKTSTTGTPNTNTSQNQNQGGSSGISGTPLPASASASGASMTIRKFDVNSKAITDGQGLYVHWTVDYSTPAIGYWAEFHLSGTPSQVSSSTKVFSRLGDSNLYAAGKDETITCVWEVSATTATLSCPGYGNRTPAALSPLYGILRACTYGSFMEVVCSQSVIDFSPPAPASAAGVTALTPAMTIDRFDVAPAAIQHDQPVTIQWDLKVSRPAVGYTAEFYLSNGRELPPDAAPSRILATGGTLDAGTIDGTGTIASSITCKRTSDPNGTVLDCGNHGSAYVRADQALPLFGILKACANDGDNRPVCAEKAVQLTFP